MGHVNHSLHTSKHNKPYDAQQWHHKVCDSTKLLCHILYPSVFPNHKDGVTFGHSVVFLFEILQPKGIASQGMYEEGLRF